MSRSVLWAWGMVLLAGHLSQAATHITFDQDDGYTTKNLYHQPGEKGSWDGDDTALINVAKISPPGIEDGKQAACVVTDTQNNLYNHLAITPLMDSFEWSFAWRTDQTSAKTARRSVAYLMNGDIKLPQAYGPYLGLLVNEKGSSLQYQYRDKEGGDHWVDIRPLTDTDWHNIRILGDIKAGVYDFYLDGIKSPLGVDLPFFCDKDLGMMNHLVLGNNYIDYDSGIEDDPVHHYFDDIVMTPEPCLSLLLTVGLGAVLRRRPI